MDSPSTSQPSGQYAVLRGEWSTGKLADTLAPRCCNEWMEQTWNPTTGCTKVSPGCKHCCAETMVLRLQAMGASGYSQGFRLALHPERLAQPLRRRKPTVYFLNSMSDLFHEDIRDTFLDRVIAVIKQTPQHTYQSLTKRAERLPTYFRERTCPPNSWLGVSV